MLPLFATTNAYKYVDICTEMLVWYKTASVAEIVLAENFVFTRPTPDGKRIFTDRRQEIFNFLFRGEVGRTVYPGLDSRMLHVAMNMQNLLEDRKAVKFVKGGAFTKPSKTFNESTTQSKLLKNFVLVYVKNDGDANLVAAC